VHVSVCCSVLQCVAVCCSVLQCVAVCCSVWVRHCLSVVFDFHSEIPARVAVKYVAVYVAVCCSVLHFVHEHVT